MSTYKLRIRNGPYAGRERTLTTEPVTIGRDVEASVQILDRSASRFHAEVFPVGGMYFVRDLDSKNGTYVNDERLQDEELIREGDIIKIGNTELAFDSGMALTDEDSSERIAYADDADMLSNTIEFRIDDLTDIEDEIASDNSKESRSLQMLYQVGRILGKGFNQSTGASLLDYLLKAMPAESALLFLRERSSGKLTPQIVRTLNPQQGPVISRTIIRRTVSENRAFFTADAQDDSRLDRKDSAIQKGIRSVLCVPMSIAGQTRGVVYLSRGIGDEPFEQGDMELLSACAVQLGLAYQSADEHRRNQKTLWLAISAMIKALEIRAGQVGAGERTARAAAAIGRRLTLPAAAVQRLSLAGLLSHLGELCADNDRAQMAECLDQLGRIDGFEDVVPLIRAAAGSNDSSLDIEAIAADRRVIAVAAAWEAAMRSRPDDDTESVLSSLEVSGDLDQDTIAALRACHLDGSLYQESLPH